MPFIVYQTIQWCLFISVLATTVVLHGTYYNNNVVGSWWLFTVITFIMSVMLTIAVQQ